jgi:NADPH:quinone reductase-like Zn-dependent oxidoreductase
MKTNKMKIVEYSTYGSPEVMTLTEIDIPQPGENEILINIHSTTVTATECNFRAGDPFLTRLFTGLRKPKIKTLGEEMAGVVVAVGSGVTTYKAGDEVFGTAGPKFGANAEYICVPQNGVFVKKPFNRSYDESAASVDGFLTALPFLRDKGKIKEGQDVLVIGASGSVGSAAVQIAKYYGARVTGVCSSSNVDWVQKLGADHVIDYTLEDFARHGKQYDIIFDAVGKSSFTKCKSSLREDGVFLEAGMKFGVILSVLWTSMFGKKKAKIHATGLRPTVERKKDLFLLKELMEQGHIQPVIDRKYSMEDIVDAHAYVDTGRKKGNVVIQVMNTTLSAQAS